MNMTKMLAALPAAAMIAGCGTPPHAADVEF